ncbi:hypothetical protein BpHYR1_030163 [Brachionus plicatilis]|uniref:Uncharacterized protein n=1 Tax=Brachionus plicatilis TaxID=10195 RepID=A0A3M7R8U9_BRAPC|nr:hypothetical protein BpHYR1_030163 [Brachionus plicatilis]
MSIRLIALLTCITKYSQEFDKNHQSLQEHFFSFLRPHKISMANQTFYKYSLFLLYNIHTLLFHILNKNLSLFNYHINLFLFLCWKKNYAQITKIDLDFCDQTLKKSRFDSLVLLFKKVNMTYK